MSLITPYKWWKGDSFKKLKIKKRKRKKRGQVSGERAPSSHKRKWWVPIEGLVAEKMWMWRKKMGIIITQDDGPLSTFLTFLQGLPSSLSGLSPFTLPTPFHISHSLTISYSTSHDLTKALFGSIGLIEKSLFGLIIKLSSRESTRKAWVIIACGLHYMY